MNRIEKTGEPHTKEQIKTPVLYHTQIKLKWIKELNVGVKIKTLRRKHKSKSSWSWIKQWFFRYDTKSKSDNKRKFIEI